MTQFLGLPRAYQSSTGFTVQAYIVSVRKALLSGQFGSAMGNLASTPAQPNMSKAAHGCDALYCRTARTATKCTPQKKKRQTNLTQAPTLTGAHWRRH